MKVLLTDGKGFIGSNFIEMFGKKYDLYVPDDEEEGFDRVENALHMFEGETYDAVVHVVASDAADALVAFKNVQYAAVAAGMPKMIVVTEAAPPPKGDAVLAGDDTFDASAPLFSADLSRYLIPALVRKDNISTMLRAFGLFGKGMPPASPLTKIFSAALTGKKPIALPPEKTFSVLYIDDLCKIVAKFLDGDLPKGVYNAASPVAATYGEFAKKAKAYAKKTGREVAIEKNDRTGNEFTANTEKLQNALGAFKFTSLATGVNKTLDYYVKHKSKLK